MKICIVKLSALGDIVHAMIVLDFLKKNIKDVEIDWVVESAFVDILKNNSNINNILPVNLKSIKKNKKEIFSQYKLLKKYSKNNYDIIIDAQGLLKSAVVSKLIGAKTIIGFDKNSIRESIATCFYNKTVSIAYSENVILRNMKVICSSLDIVYDTQDILEKKAFLYSSCKEINKVEILFVVGASRENKIYPKDKFLELANLLKDYNIEVIWASESEKKVAKYLSDNSSNVSVCKKMTLDELKNKIKNTRLVIGGDTGPTHMAWGLNTPSITIFGNTPEYRNTYITDINKVIKSDSFVDSLQLDKNDYSIMEIKPQDIVDLANKLI